MDSKMKIMRKGTIVKYVGGDKEFVETWGDLFEVYHKEGNFVRVSSVKKPSFGIIATIPCKECKIVDNR